MTRRIGGNAARVPVTVHGPHPLAVAIVGRLDLLHGRGMDGRTGSVRIGLTGDVSGRYNGDLPPMQSFHGFTAPNLANLRPGERRGLPNTQPPLNEPISPALAALRGQR